MYCDCRPRLIGFHVLPPSSVRNAPAAEMAMNMRFGFFGIEQDRVQAHSARARLPVGPVSWSRRPGKFVPGLAAVG